MKILQINTSLFPGSTGRIVSEIGELITSNGHESIISIGRGPCSKNSDIIRIGNKKDLLLHIIYSRLFDRHGFGSLNATEKAIKEFLKNTPDIFHLHNLHGYYVNIKALFEYLNASQKPIIWTFHDCWPITGHCSYFDRVNCLKWKSGCHSCPLYYGYPKSWYIDNSSSNYTDKKAIFNAPHKMVLVAPSVWMADILKSSFLGEFPVKVINNGVDLDKFKPVKISHSGLEGIDRRKKIILGVASIWDRRKGFDDFLKLRSMLDSRYLIVLVGLNKNKVNKLPEGIIGIPRTESQQQLAELYSIADVFVNPTYVDNFPTVNIEALACGTPVVTYRTGGSPESIDEKTGRIIEKGDIHSLKTSIEDLIGSRSKELSLFCRERAVKYYNKNERYKDYLNLYSKVVETNYFQH